MDSSTIPIDIHYAKLEDWLLDRRAVIAKKHPKQYAKCVEKAPELLQIVKYDLPAVKKNISRCRGGLDDMKKREAELSRSFSSLRAKRVELLGSLGLLSDNILNMGDTDEREAAVSDLLNGVGLDRVITKASADTTRKAQEHIDETAKRLLPTVFAQYDQHVKQHFSSCSEAEQEKERSTKHFPWLAALLEQAEKGDAQQGATGANDTAAAAAGDAANDGPVIDWGEDDVDATAAGAPAAAEINWGDDAGAVPAAAAVEIDWGDLDIDVDGGVAAKAATEAPALGTIEDALQDRAATPPPNVSCGDALDAAKSSHRSALVDELETLQAFFIERVHGEKTLDETQRDPKLGECQGACDELLTSITNEVFLTLLRMETNFRVKERYMTQVEQVGYKLSTNKARVGESGTRAVELEDEITKELQPKIEELIEKVRGLKGDVEGLLSECFAPREVHITGDINNLISGAK